MLQLFLELPNPGGRGRRMLASAVGSARPDDIHGHARTGSEGSDFLAVEWPTVQRLESQAVRDDADRVMLVGVDTARVPPVQQDRVRDALRELRPEIARILASIDWNTAGQETVIESAALAELLQRPVFLDLPTRAEASQSRRTDATTTVRPPTGNTPRAAALVGSAIVLVAFMTWWRTSSSPPPPPPPTPDLDLKAATNAMGCSEPELRSWINSSRGKPADAPIDVLALRLLSERGGVARFFVFDQSPAEQSQLFEFLELLNPRTANECMAVRAGIHKAHNHLVALQASAVSAGRCRDWRRKLESTNDEDLTPLPQQFIGFIKSLVSFGGEPLADGKGLPEPEDPFFRDDDHRKFKELASFFTPERRSPMSEAIGRKLYTTDRSSTALFEAVETMPLWESERKQLRANGETAYARTECPAFKELLPHFNEMCDAIGRLPRTGREP